MCTNEEFYAFIEEFGFTKTAQAIQVLYESGELAENLAMLLLAKLSVERGIAGLGKSYKLQ